MKVQPMEEVIKSVQTFKQTVMKKTPSHLILHASEQKQQVK